MHEECATGRGTAQVLVAVVGIACYAALGAALGVGNLCGKREFARDQSFGYFVHVQREAMRLLGM